MLKLIVKMPPDCQKEAKADSAPGGVFTKRPYSQSRRQYKMTSLPKRLTELVIAPRARLIWLALAGFFLGSALCPFNPPAGDQPQTMKESEEMNSPSESKASVETQHFNGLASASSEIETATFALG